MPWIDVERTGFQCIGCSMVYDLRLNTLSNEILTQTLAMGLVQNESVSAPFQTYRRSTSGQGRRGAVML